MLYYIRFDRLINPNNAASRDFLWAFMDENISYDWGYSLRDYSSAIRAGDYTYWRSKHKRIEVLR